MSKKSEFLTNIKSVTDNVHFGKKSASDVADSVNSWLKEGGEALKVKIEDEVERSVSKMGFVKRGEFEALKQEIAALKKGAPKASKKAPAAKKPATAKKPAVKSETKKSTKKAATKKKVAASKKESK